MKKTIFIGSDFPLYQYLYIIPIIHGFSQREKIQKIIFEDQLPTSIIKQEFIKKILKKYEISYAKNYVSKIYLKNKSINLLLILFYNPIKFFSFIFGVIFKSKDTNCVFNEMYHAIIDYANYLSSSNKGRRDLLSLIASILINFKKFCLIEKIIKLEKNNIKFAALGHSVYHSRVALTLFRKKNIKTLIQANSILYFFPRYKDIHFSFLKLNKYPTNKIKIKKKIIDNYWLKRIEGKGNYQDANIAVRTKNNFKKNLCYNFIFLHVFKDSPFHYIDNNRIFFDYYDWVSKTLEILNSTNEKWVLKLHPSFSKWGENQRRIVNDLINKYYNKDKKDLIIDDQMSNIEIFKIARKIITYNGTMHLEAASFGKKPIVITDVTLSRHDKSLVKKPINIDEYKHLILNKNYKSFEIKNQKKIDLAKKLIFIRENVFPLKKDIGEKTVYRKDLKKLIKNNFISVHKNVIKNLKFLEDIGFFLSKYKISTFSKKYFKKIK